MNILLDFVHIQFLTLRMPTKVFWIKAISIRPCVIKFLNYYSERVLFVALKLIVQVLITYQETVKTDTVRQYVLSL